MIRVAAELQVARMTIYRLKKAGGALPQVPLHDGRRALDVFLLFLRPLY